MKNGATIVRRFDDLVKAWSRLGRRLTLLRNSTDFDGIDHGIVFVVAPWSGPSILTFKRRTQALCDAKFASVPVYVVDVDDLDDAWWKCCFQRPSCGARETFWIKDRRVAHVLWNDGDSDGEACHRFTGDLLSE